jgi:predicted nucleotidyltransferase
MESFIIYELYIVHMNSNEYNVLKVFFGRGSSVFFRDLVKSSGVSVGGVQQVLKKYGDFLARKEEGRNVYYSIREGIDRVYLLKLFETERARRFLGNHSKFKEFFRFIVEKDIYAVIFGGYAKGAVTKKSDLDVLVLSSKKIPEHLCPIESHVISLNKREFELAARKKETLIEEVRKNHVIINGVDYFVSKF